MRMPRPKINTNWLLLGAAVVLGVGAVYLSNQLIRSKMAELEAEAKRGQETVNVVVAKRDLERGDAITSEVMAVRAVPKEFVSTSAITPNQFADFERQRLVVPIKRGEPLLAIHSEGNGTSVFSATLKKGHRALTFEVDTVNSISGMLRPGDFIDLIYTSKSPGLGDQDVTLPLLSRVQVMATDQVLSKRNEATGQERSFTTITLELSPLDADRIIVAKKAGQLTAVLRHPDDDTPNGTRSLTALGLLQSTTAPKPGNTIEYLVGGGGGLAELQLAQALTAKAVNSQRPPGVTLAAPQ
jgi:pilus assembly protein CpaB